MKELTDNLLKTYKSIKPSETESKARSLIYNMIRTHILDLYPQSEVSLFGSFYTGTFIHSSDIDISVQIDTKTPNLILKNIKKKLINSKIYKNIIHLGHARIPILKFKDNIYNFKFDISINNNGGIQAAKFVKSILDKNEYIKMFCVLIKHFICNRNMGDASVGGLNSYSQFLMIYNYFQIHPLINYLEIRENLVILFVDFIIYYGYTFKYKNVRINVKNVKYEVNNTNRLSVIDPTDENIDVGNCCKNFEMVMEVFQNLYRIVKKSVEDKRYNIFEEVFNIKDKERLERQAIISKYNSKDRYKDIDRMKKLKRKYDLRDINLYKRDTPSKVMYSTFVSDLRHETNKITKRNKTSKEEEGIDKPEITLEETNDSEIKKKNEEIGRRDLKKRRRRKDKEDEKSSKRKEKTKKKKKSKHDKNEK